MAFQFRLEKVLRHRKNLEQLAKKNYLIALNQFIDSETKLKNLNMEIEKAQLERHNLVVQGGIQSERLCQIFEYIKGIEIKIERQKIEVKKNLAIVEELKLVLQEAAIEYKMIEKLKERKHESYRQNEKKLEEKIQTEMTNARFELGRKDEE